MAAFSGVNHVSLSVTDLNRSECFYTDVFDLIRMMDFGYGRVLLHPQTGFIFGIATHEGAEGEPFSELKTGLDHFGLYAASRAELVEWEQKLDMLGVVYTPIRDMEFGYHLNFRDPDNIALEIMGLQRDGRFFPWRCQPWGHSATRSRVKAQRVPGLARIRRRTGLEGYGRDPAAIGGGTPMRGVGGDQRDRHQAGDRVDRDPKVAGGEP